MRAIIVDPFNDYEIRTKYVYERLCRMGYETTFLVSDFDHLSKEKVTWMRANTVFIKTKPYYKNISFSRIFSHLAFAKKAYKYIGDFAPDLIYSVVPLNSLVKYLHKYKKHHRDVKIVLDIFDLWPESLPANSFIKKLLFSWKNMRDKHLGCASKIVLECEYYKKFLPPKFEYDVLYLCKDKQMIQFASVEDELNFLYLGSVNNIIDIDGIVGLLCALQSTRKVWLHIIGGGESEELFEDKLRSANIPYTCHGMIFDEREKNEIISKCQFGINMYKEGLCIGLTMKSLDYFSRGLPVVSHNIYDTAKIIGEMGCGIDIFNVADIPNELLSCNKYSWEQMHENAAITFEKYFTVEKFNDEIDAVFSKLDKE